MFNFYFSPAPSFWTMIAPYITSLVTAVLAIGALVWNEKSKRRSEREAVRVAVSRAKHEQKRQALFKVIPCLRRAMRLANSSCQRNGEANRLSEDIFKKAQSGDFSEAKLDEIRVKQKELKDEADEYQRRTDQEIDVALGHAVEYGDYPTGANMGQKWLNEYVRAWGYRLGYDPGRDMENKRLTERFEGDLKLLVDHENRVLDALASANEQAVKTEAVNLRKLDDNPQNAVPLDEPPGPRPNIIGLSGTSTRPAKVKPPEEQEEKA